MAAQETTAPKSPFSFKRFFREVKGELKKVSWPTRRELVTYTGIVFVSVAIVAVLIWIVDAMFSELLQLILK